MKAVFYAIFRILRQFSAPRSAHLLAVVLVLLTGLPWPLPAQTDPSPYDRGAETATAGQRQLVGTPGWTCLSNEAGSDWNCTLRGPDPQGHARVISERHKTGAAEPAPSVADSEQVQDRGLGIIALDSHVANFSWEDEEIFSTLQQMTGTDAWGMCSASMGPPAPVEGWDEQAPMTVESDYTEVFEEDIATFVGNVDVTHVHQKIYADRATYDSIAETLSAQGSVRYREPGLSLYSDRVFLKQKSGTGRLQNPRFLLETIPARGRAKVAYRDSPTRTRFRDISYTTCRPGNEDWVLGAKILKINRATGRGSARHAWLRLKGIPVMYTPYISFPIDDRRKSGFLSPSYGSNDETGFDLTVPYYWNIAPNLDATFFPRLLSKRGLMLGGEFRYLTPRTEGLISAEYMPDDSERNEARGQFTVLNKTRFSPYLSTDMDVNFVSDDEYLDELGNTLSFSNTRHVKSEANLHYNRFGMSFLARVQNYQTIDDELSTLDKPYRRLPQLLLNVADRRLGASNFQSGLSSEFVYFDHSDQVTAKRLDFKPHISYPIKTSYGFLTPRFTLQHTQYWLNDQNDGVSSNIDRTLPIVSVDSGLFFERDLELGNSGFIQTLEPRLFYLFVPNDDQDDIPIFDTAQYDFSFQQLFRENRFSGTDRVNDANQVTLALTSRLLESASGRERIRASIGQIFYLKDLEVQLPGQETITDSSSNMVGELNAILSDHWSFRSAIQWNPHTSDGDRRQFALNYRNTTDKLLNLTYRYRKNIIDQSDASFRWPIVSDWFAVGRWQYSFIDNVTLDGFLGLEKESCCWRFRILGRHYANDGNSEANNGIYVQLELKGFTSFGDKVDRFLERSISGYRIPEY